MKVVCKWAKAKASSFQSSWSCSHQEGAGDSWTHSNRDHLPQRMGKRSKQSVVCNKCNESGHYANCCPNKKPRARKKPRASSK